MKITNFKNFRDIPENFTGVCKVENVTIHYENGKRHRIDGPAVEYESNSEYGSNGVKEWWVDGNRHREDGPAVELDNGRKEWYINNKPHRLDGPAMVGANGMKAWWIDGTRYTEEEFNKMKKPEIKEPKIELFTSITDMPKKFTGKCKFKSEVDCINDYKNGNLIKEEYSNGDKYWYKNDYYHREDGPAVELASGQKEWYKKGNLHRLDGPAVEFADGRKEWYKNGEIHRIDGPACEFPDGRKEWFANGLQHRLDGPAVENANGDKFWHKNGAHHRTDGPALEFADGKKFWYINGKEYTEKEFNKKLSKNVEKTNIKPKINIKEFKSYLNVPENFNGICKLKDINQTRYYKDGKFHREDGPAIERTNGDKEWWFEGKSYSEEEFNKKVASMNIEEFKSHDDVPKGTSIYKVKIYDKDETTYYKDGKRHREDGPAVENADGKQWFINGKRHRIDGPAIELADGTKQWYVDDKRHREDGPAIEYASGIKEWYVNDKRHREDGPAIEYADGSKYWYLNGQIHRTDGAAIEWASGNKEWLIESRSYSEKEFTKKIATMNMKTFQKYSDVPKDFTGICKLKDFQQTRYYKDGKLHREDGPAIEKANGTKHWFINDQRHREDGPAIEYANGGKVWYQHGQLHRTDGAAIEHPDGRKEWYIEYKKYSEEDFAKKVASMNIKEYNLYDVPKDFTGICKIKKYNQTHYYKDGKLHREDGPATEWVDGSKVWWLNGQRHRTDGPAIEFAEGDKYWYINDKRHREDGPAVEFANGDKEWFIKGKQYSEKEFAEEVSKINIKEFISHNDVPKDFTGVCKIEDTIIHCKDGKYHREDGPAVETANGNKEWWINGKRHRTDGPAKEFATGYKQWYINGKSHREDGPAVEHADGSKEWYKDGKRHREDGPAIEYADGDKKWYLNDKRHREDGPAVEFASGNKQWWIEGNNYSEKEFTKKIATMNIKKFTSYDDVPNLFTGVCKIKDEIVHYKQSQLHREDGPAVEREDGNKMWYINGKRHREGGPAIEFANGGESWYINGKCHREDGPAYEYDGNKSWYQNGKLHREDGPAKEFADGRKEWFINGKRHREDGPAIEYPNGDKEWWINNQLHRENGPAIEWVDGRKQWWIEGKKYSEEEFTKKIATMNVKEFKSLNDVPKDFNGLYKIKMYDEVTYYKDGKLHREDGPAIENIDGDKEWFINGQRHRIDGPAAELADGTKAWWVNGVIHREDGPAVEASNGDKEWFINGKRHRENGPAREHIHGNKEWCVNGQLHRTDGPAIERPNGDKFWYIEGNNYSEEEFNKKIESMNVKEFLHLDEIPKHFTGVCKIKDETRYYKMGSLHREDGPAYIYDGKFAHKIWFINNEYHREDGPACEYADGTKSWYLNGQRHRTDGPAIESNGNKSWWLNGKEHREDGPAVENADGYKEWWINGRREYKIDKQTSFIRRNSNKAFYRIAAEQSTNIIKQFIISAISKSTTIENAHQILNTNVGKILLQSAIGLVLNDLDYNNVHIKKITEEMLISSITNIENTMIDYVINQTINNTTNNNLISQDLVRIQEQVHESDLFEETNNYESLKA